MNYACITCLILGIFVFNICSIKSKETDNDPLENVQVFDDSGENSMALSSRKNSTLKAISSIMSLASLQQKPTATFAKNSSKPAAESIEIFEINSSSEDNANVGEEEQKNQSAEKADLENTENAEALANVNISADLMSKILPEILKYSGRAAVPASSEDTILKSSIRQQNEPYGEESAAYIRQLGHDGDADSKSSVTRSQRLVESRESNEETDDTVEFSHFDDTYNVSRLEELFDLYNPYRLWQLWPGGFHLSLLSSACKVQMETFLSSLQKATPWALKMWDASGHYSGSYFWGNPYWMGSRTLCGEISKSDPDVPFNLGFFVLWTNLSLNYINTGRMKSQYVGLCLPHSCSKMDVQLLAERSISSAVAQKDRHVEIVRVKSPHDYYNMYQDKTFWIILLCCIVAGGLLLVGTVLDLLMEERRRNRNTLIRKMQTKYKYDNYTYAVNPPLPLTTDKLNGNANHLVGTTNCSGDVTPASEPEELKTGIWHEVFLSFSVVRNMKQICDSTIGADTIPIIHGLRSISMAWVILGHTCIVAFKYSDNMEFRKVAERELLYQTINNTAFTVDTFFFISGLLVSFLYFRTTAKVNVDKLTKTTGFLSHCIEFIGLIGYRFCRLTIPYIFTLGLVEISMKWFYYNSVFDPPADDHINCPNYWWRNLLYINTLFPVKDMCMLWSWYLADDTQFYILGIVLLITAVRHFKMASVSVVVLLIASWCTTGYIAYLNNHMPNMDDPLALFDKIYDKPWTRFGPYLIGMIVGWILFKTDCKIEMKKVTSATGWLLCCTGMLSLIYGLHKKQLDSITAAAYSSLSHTGWAVCLSWIVIACSTGHGGYANSVLSSKLLIPFSRTTYCAYLIHPIIIRLVVMKRDSPVHLSEETIAIMFLGQLTASYLLAFALSVAFEAPIVSLLKIVSPTKRNKMQ